VSNYVVGTCEVTCGGEDPIGNSGERNRWVWFISNFSLEIIVRTLINILHDGMLIQTRDTSIEKFIRQASHTGSLKLVGLCARDRRTVNEGTDKGGSGLGTACTSRLMRKRTVD